MQDYIDIIDDMDLLNNKQNDNIEVIPPVSEPVVSKASPTTTNTTNTATTQPPIALKKAVLAKLPEENHDKWKALEHSMNKESIDNEKIEKDIGLMNMGQETQSMIPTMMDKQIKSLPMQMGFQNFD